MPDFLLVPLYVAVLWAPGGLLGAVAGLRGWTLTAVAPLLTYTVAGLAGPWTYALPDALGLRWQPLTFLGWLVVFVAVALVVRGRAAALTPWPWRAHAGLAACLVAAAGISIFVVGHGMGGLATIPQDWDAAWHANSVRWIADTGEGGLFAPGALNWYESSQGMFYPNGYHLVAALVSQLSGASVVAVLNAHTALIPALLALSTATLVRRFGGRAVVAGLSALLIVATASVYDMLWRGPLLPFATGVALTPLAVVLIADYLDARRPAGPGAVLVLGMAGLICVHPSALFGAVLFAAPMLAVRWWRARDRLRGELARLVLAGLATGVLAAAQLLGATGSGADVPPVDWRADQTASQAIGELLTWGHAQRFPQWWLAIALVLGLVTYRRLGELRWLGVVAVAFGALFVVAAAYDTWWANDITRPWWNDRWRLVALTAIPLCVIAAHGLAEVQRFTARFTPRPAAAVAVTLVVAVVTSGFYVGRNETRMGYNTGDGPAVSAREVAGYEELAKLVRPGERVLNDRGDGSVWMYALAGVHPVAGHYDATLTGPDATLLAERFRDYDTDQEVRAAARRLNVTYVVVGRGFLRDRATRQPGLRGLTAVSALTRVYENPDIVIYWLDKERS